MSKIIMPTFTQSDIQVLEGFNEEEIQGYIDFFRDYKEMMWLNNDTGEIVSDSELRKMKLHMQPTPQYPNQLLQLGERCSKIGVGGFGLLKEEGFFDKESPASLFPCTLFTPTLICTLFADAFQRSCLCDGLLGFGIKDGIYLKMMLHLQDCRSLYCYLKDRPEQHL